MDSSYIHPPCPICHEPVIQRDGERNYRWRIRATCSHACAARLHGLSTKARNRAPRNRHPPCKNCGKAVHRSGNETPEAWLARDYCSGNCRRMFAAIKNGWPAQDGKPFEGEPFAEHNLTMKDTVQYSGIFPPQTREGQ